MNLISMVAVGCVLYTFIWWAGRRDFRFFGTDDDSTSSAMGGIVGELTELFQPSRRIETEERMRVRDARQGTESGDPPFGIDLDAGTARITRPRS